MGTNSAAPLSSPQDSRALDAAAGSPPARAAEALKILIFGTCYVQNDARRDVTRWWAAIHNQRNLDCDVLLVDSNSPFEPQKFLKPFGFEYEPIREDVPIRTAHRKVISFPDNIGHLNITQQDGWGRAMSTGFQAAIDGGYDYVFYNDGDILFAPQVRPIMERLAAKDVKVAAPMDVLYWFMENGLLFANVDYLRDIDFIGRYDWSSRGSMAMGGPLSAPEYVFEQIFGDEFWALPLRGLRNDYNQLSVTNIEESFFYGLDYVTHCADPALYLAFMKRNGIHYG